MCGIWKQDDSKLEGLHIRVAGPTSDGVGDKVWVIHGSRRDIVSAMHEEVVVLLTLSAAQDHVEAAASH
jgi:hypothetical protein